MTVCAFFFQVGYWWFLKNIESPQNLSTILAFIWPLTYSPICWRIGRPSDKEVFKGPWNEAVKAQRQRDRYSLGFFMINQHISEVDLVHLQHVTQTNCDNDLQLNVGNRVVHPGCCRCYRHSSLCFQRINL